LTPEYWGKPWDSLGPGGVTHRGRYYPKEGKFENKTPPREERRVQGFILTPLYMDGAKPQEAFLSKGINERRPPMGATTKEVVGRYTTTTGTRATTRAHGV